MIFSNPNAEMVSLLKLNKRKVSINLREKAVLVDSLVSEHTFCRRMANSRRELTSSSLTVNNYFWIEDLLTKAEGIASVKLRNVLWFNCEDERVFTRKKSGSGGVDVDVGAHQEDYARNMNSSQELIQRWE